MTRQDLIQRLNDLPDDAFERVAPFLQADLEVADDLQALHEEIRAGRRSAEYEPLIDAKDVYARVRRALSE